MGTGTVGGEAETRNIDETVRREHWGVGAAAICSCVKVGHA